MIKIHYCNLFEKKIANQPFENSIRNKISKIVEYSELKYVNDVKKFSNYTFIYTTHNGAKIFFQRKIFGEFTVYFVRDFIEKNRKINEQLSNRKWLENNELPDEDYNNFVENIQFDINNIQHETSKNPIINQNKEIITFNPDSINDKLIQFSTKEDARKNAEKDKEQGIYDKNAARLKVAAIQFFNLKDYFEGYFCLAISEEINENWKKAAEYYLKKELNNSKLEEAASCYFKGRYFKEIQDEIGNNLRNFKQDIRLVVVRVMLGNPLMKSDIEVLYKNKEIFNQVLLEINWRDELINSLIFNSKSIIEIKLRKKLLDIFEGIKTSNDFELIKLIGTLYFELNNFEKAIETWDSIDFYDNENYCKAQIEIAKQKSDNENIILWLGEILNYKNNNNDKNQIYNEIIDIYYKNENLEISEFNYYLFVYEAIIILNQQNKIEIIGKKVEDAFNNQLTELINFYTKILKNKNINTKIAIFLIERLAKITWRKNNKNIDVIEENIWLEKLNLKYLEISKIFNIPFIEFDLDELIKISDEPKLSWNPSAHFSHFKVKNFRQFNEIEIKKIGQFNLILGDNNVGKTSLLEALLFSINKEQYFKNLAFCYIERENSPRYVNEYSPRYVNEYNNEYYNVNNKFINDFYKKDIENKQIEFYLQEKRNVWNYKIRPVTKEEIYCYTNETNGVDIENFIGFISNENIEIIEFLKKLNPKDAISSSFIPFGKGFNKDLAQIYSENIDKYKAKLDAFLLNMKIFIKNITRIIPDNLTGKIDIDEEGFEKAATLYQYGEGANKLFRILVQISLQKDKCLLIDEIDSGIHFSRFYEFWKVILKVAKENNVQIFASTHNFECIKYFKDILEKEEFIDYQKDSRIITLLQLPNKNIKAFTRKFNEFSFEIDSELELRGGDNE